MVAAILVIWLAALGGVLAAYLLYLRTLNRALERCAPQNRTMSPGMVWLQLVPLVGLGWQFVNVVSLGKSLENEYRSRGIAMRRPHQGLGIAMGVFFAAAVVLLWVSDAFVALVDARSSFGYTSRQTTSIEGLMVIAGLAILGGLVLWVIYWVRISRTSARLAATAPAYRQPQWGPPAFARPSTRAATRTTTCRNCGSLYLGGRFCPDCGADQTLARPQFR